MARYKVDIISTGEFKTLSCKWRIVKVGGVYYYDVTQYDRLECRYRWVNILHSMELSQVLEKRNDDISTYGGV